MGYRGNIRDRESTQESSRETVRCETAARNRSYVFDKEGIDWCREGGSNPHEVISLGGF